MDIKEAIKERHSVRQFQDIPVTEVDRERLIELIDACNAESGLHIQLILNDPDCFNTFLAHYGKFTNANNYIALVGKKSDKDLDERCGYYGQRIVLEAQMMGLNTCWVAGTYGKGKCKASIDADERIVCVIAIVKLTPGLIGWADMIFCFEKKHLRRIKENYAEEIAGKLVITMNIPDEYEFKDEELQEILWSYAEEYLGNE